MLGRFGDVAGEQEGLDDLGRDEVDVVMTGRQQTFGASQELDRLGGRPCRGVPCGLAQPANGVEVAGSGTQHQVARDL